MTCDSKDKPLFSIFQKIPRFVFKYQLINKETKTICQNRTALLSRVVVSDMSSYMSTVTLTDVKHCLSKNQNINSFLTYTN